jgi:putative membrane protein
MVMATIGSVLVGLVALLHVWFLVLEMFLWQRPIGRRIFRTSEEKAAVTAQLAKNQGLYNGFLAAGLFWGFLLAGEGAPHARAVTTFFLGCVIVAGLYGGATVSPRIALVQALPAAIAFAPVWLSWPHAGP